MQTSTTTSSSSSSASSFSSFLMKNATRPATAKKSGGRGKGLFVFTCGCKDTTSMCVTPSRSNSSISTTPITTTNLYLPNLRRHSRAKSDTSTTATATLTSTSTSTSTISLATNRGEQRQKSDHPDDVMKEEEEEERGEEQRLSTSTSPNFSTLLRELGQLEQSLIELDYGRISVGKRKKEVEEEVRFDLLDEMRNQSGSERKGTVAVVTETEDPIGDFRKSMVLMIEENDINTEEELKDLLSQFLALNSPENHHLVLHAFADVCDDFFLR